MKHIEFKPKRDRSGKPILGDWNNMDGVVYLFRCANTNAYKLGGSVNPLQRFACLISQEKHRRGLYPVYIWSIITNGVGRLESFWLNEWRQYRAFDAEFEKRFEWFRPPDSEVSRFRSFGVVNWKNLKPVSKTMVESLSPLPPSHRWCQPPPRLKGRRK